MVSAAFQGKDLKISLPNSSGPFSLSVTPEEFKNLVVEIIDELGNRDDVRTLRVLAEITEIPFELKKRLALHEDAMIRNNIVKSRGFSLELSSLFLNETDFYVKRSLLEKFENEPELVSAELIDVLWPCRQKDLPEEDGYNKELIEINGDKFIFRTISSGGLAGRCYHVWSGVKWLISGSRNLTEDDIQLMKQNGMFGSGQTVHGSISFVDTTNDDALASMLRRFEVPAAALAAEMRKIKDETDRITLVHFDGSCDSGD
jgi:hypothetical protein